MIRSMNNDIKVSLGFGNRNEYADESIPKPTYEFENAFHEYPEILEEIRKQGSISRQA